MPLSCFYFIFLVTYQREEEKRLHMENEERKKREKEEQIKKKEDERLRKEEEERAKVQALFVDFVLFHIFMHNLLR